MRLRGFVIFLPALCWLSFSFWQEHHLIQKMESNPMLLEATSPTWVAILTWVSLIAMPLGAVLAVVDFARRKQRKVDEPSG
jgi:hypothetical protein